MITYTLDIDSDDVLYCYFPSEYPREIKLKVGKEDVGKHMGKETHGIKSLGRFETGEDITVTAVLQEKDMYLATSGAIFYYFDEDVYKEAMRRLGTSPYEISTTTEDTFTGTLHVEEGQELIYTSIPYDAGWIVKIDGAVVETEEIVGALLAFRTTPGNHTLELEYRPDCVIYGTYISLCGISVFVLICISEWITKRRKIKSVDMR